MVPDGLINRQPVTVKVDVLQFREVSFRNDLVMHIIVKVTKLKGEVQKSIFCFSGQI